MKKGYLFFTIFSLFIFGFSPTITGGAILKESQNIETSTGTPEITVQSEKIEEGLYHFSFTSNMSNVSENDKLNAFLKQLTKFKKDHSGETVIGYQALPSNETASIGGYMVSTEKKAMSGAVLAAIITGLITGGIGLFTLIYTILNNKKTLFVNSVTSERVKWMGQLKEHVAEFISLASFYNEKPVLEDAKEKGDYLDKVIHAKAKIILHLNYRGDEDKEIIQLVDKMSGNILKAYDAFALQKKSDKEKSAYFVEMHKEQLAKRAKSKLDKKVNDSKHQNLTDKEAVLNLVQKIFQESWNEEFENYNKKSEENFRQLKAELVNNSDILLKLTQKYLKNEWNRVKEEAEKGNLSKKK